MHRFSSILERRVVVVNVGREEYLGVPCEPLRGGEVRDLHEETISARGNDPTGG